MAGDTVASMRELLERLELHSLVEVFVANAVTARDFLALTDAEMREDLGMSHLQIKKLRAALGAPEPAAAAAAAAPAAAPAAAAPAAAAGAARPFDRALLARFRDQRAAAAELEATGADAKLAAAQRELASARQRAAAAAADEQRSAAAAAAAQQAAADKREGFHLSKVLCSGSYDARLAELDAACAGAGKQLGAVREALPPLRAAADAAAAELAVAQAAAAQLAAARAARDATRAQLFAGGAPGDATLAAAEADVAQLAPRAAAAQGEQQAAAAAERQLAAAQQQLGQALRELQSAFGLATLNTAEAVMHDFEFGRRRHDGMMQEFENMREMQLAQQAGARCDAALAAVDAARAALPSLPSVDARSVERIRGMFGAVVFTNVFSDFVVRQSIQQNIGHLQAFHGSVGQALGYARAELQRAGAEAAQLGAQASQRHADAERRRDELLTAALLEL